MRIKELAECPLRYGHTPQGETEQNLALMRLIDMQLLDKPFFGVRQMTCHLRNEGHAVNEKRVRRFMRVIGLMPIYQKPDTSKPTKGHKTYPYLLRGLQVDRLNQVWCVDITYLPALGRFSLQIACRAAVRGHLSVRTAEQHEQRSVIAGHVVCLDRPPAPVRNSHLDGRQGPLVDNIFSERLCRTRKNERDSLHAWEAGSQARTWMEFYNRRRPHKTLGGQPPALVYSQQIEATQPDQQEKIRA